MPERRPYRSGHLLSFWSSVRQPFRFRQPGGGHAEVTPSGASFVKTFEPHHCRRRPLVDRRLIKGRDRRLACLAGVQFPRMNVARSMPGLQML
jgi:hypothetical protein